MMKTSQIKLFKLNITQVVLSKPFFNLNRVKYVKMMDTMGWSMAQQGLKTSV